MANEAPVELYSSDTLADFAAVTRGDSSYIVVIDHTFELAGVKSTDPVEKTGWHFWRIEHQGETTEFRKLPDAMIPLPTSQAVALSMFGDSLAAVVEANNMTPAWMMLWNLTSPGVADLAGVTPQSIPLGLDTAQVAQIRIPAGADWSTDSLPPELWLFHAGVSATRETGHVVAVLNTADAHAIVFQHTPGESTARSTAFVPNALEPAFLEADGKTLLFYRKPTPDWSVHFHDVRISGTYGPVALPLEMAELNSTGGIEPSMRLEVGDVFVHSILPGPDGRTTLATVTGSLEKPELQLHVADIPRAEFQLRRTVPLSFVPFRISMTSDKQGILMALGFLGEGGGFRVEALYARNE